ncbi:6-phosphogluconolactonase, partial [Bacillus sp. SIMBA_033]
GDERFVAADSEDRNTYQAHQALLAHLQVDPDRVHQPGSTDDFGTAEEAAAAYAADLKAAAEAEHAADMSDNRPDAPSELPRF